MKNVLKKTAGLIACLMVVSFGSCSMNVNNENVAESVAEEDSSREIFTRDQKVLLVPYDNGFKTENSKKFYEFSVSEDTEISGFAYNGTMSLDLKDTNLGGRTLFRFGLEPLKSLNMGGIRIAVSGDFTVDVDRDVAYFCAYLDNNPNDELCVVSVPKENDLKTYHFEFEIPCYNSDRENAYVYFKNVNLYSYFSEIKFENIKVNYGPGVHKRNVFNFKDIPVIADSKINRYDNKLIFACNTFEEFVEGINLGEFAGHYATVRLKAEIYTTNLEPAKLKWNYVTKKDGNVCFSTMEFKPGPQFETQSLYLETNIKLDEDARIYAEDINHNLKSIILYKPILTVDIID